MSTAAQIPRNSIVWLLLAQLTVILPHAQRMSWWMMAIWLLCAIWRVAMYRGEAGYPGLLLRSFLVVLGCIGVAVSFGDMGGLDIAVALLILAFSLKLIEVKARRDMYLVFNLAFFIVAAAFLFTQSVFLALYQIFSVLLVFTAMVATQHPLHNHSPGRALKTALRLVAQAVPLMVLFFVVFPRIGPIWNVSNSDSAAGTGMSDTMSPGDVARLTQSAELAFRVDFESVMPGPEKLYWRGMTLSQFDGRQWTRGVNSHNTAKSFELYGEPTRYQLIMEPTRQNWLFTLPVANTSDLEKASLSSDYVLRSQSALFKRSHFEIESFLDYRVEPLLSKGQKLQYTQLPISFNPQARSLARKLYSGQLSSSEFVQRLADYFGEQAFFYTLEPPLLGKHSIDDFVFNTRRGFCEHYASAFAFMLRSVGIPARVVIGYQGGEVNPHNGTLAVRQMDAHAWIEYWQAGLGWLRYDPTSVVAPERILYGLDGALSRRPELEAGGLLSPVVYRNFALVKSIRLRLDAMNYAWHQWVVNFDQRDQQRVLSKLLGEVTSIKLGLAVAGLLGVVLGVVAYFVIRRGKAVHKRRERVLYEKFCDKVAALGLVRKKSEPPIAFARRIIAEYPSYREEVQKITNQYVAIAYREQGSGRCYTLLKRHITNFKPVLQQ